MVPMFCTTSSRVIPIPSSSMVRVRALLVGDEADPGLVAFGRSSGLVSASKRSRSMASDALETSSRRKISLSV